jgi:hypothetical protein
LITHAHLVPRLRMSGALPLLPLYAFIEWTERPWPLWNEKSRVLRILYDLRWLLVMTPLATMTSAAPQYTSPQHLSVTTWWNNH